MDDPTQGPVDRRPPPGRCADGMGHDAPAVYTYGPPDAPRRICLAHLLERYRRSNWGRK